jgi:hypothetical protein
MKIKITLANKKIVSLFLAVIIVLGFIAILAVQGYSGKNPSDLSALPVASAQPQSNSQSYSIITSSYCGVPYDLYCPSNFSGSLVILAGGIMGEKFYLSGWGKALAERGFAALAFSTPPQDLNHVSQYTQDCNRNLQILIPYVFNASAFPISINQSDVSLVGMSGGAATILSFSDSRIKSSVAVCPYLVNNLRSLSATPTLIITGEKDTVAPTQTNGQIYYNQLSPSKMIIQQANVGHDISDIGWKYTFAWINYYTKNDNDAYSTLMNAEKDPAILNATCALP